ncbi:FAD dependent oxidoreductase [Metarhizium guizhouense ARSEF 977]|uniref:FAD dependent oxidoreductase n=1 Tax=Metarhizium guizhouense (strain ARSEF 977) TaxID=1276136 RepID=A0A0B4H1G5_METGA|nr:FAD dependent oxidoreductase [Metarhizium guizhouense ARSEF 977]
MSDTSAYGDGIRDDDTLVGDDNSSVRSFGSVSTVVSEGANPGPGLPDIDPNIPRRPDFVIIGSGMTAVGVALSFLQLMASKEKFPVVLVIEAGELCSGGTARNSGHIKFLPPMVFRFDGELQPEKVLDLQFEMEELYYDEEEFEIDRGAQRRLNELYPQKYRATILEGDEVPHYGPTILEGDEVPHEYERARGARTHTAGLVQLYHLVTSIWEDLCTQYANLRISTNNLVQNIALTTDSSHPYIVTCSRRTLQARHVVHATDSYATRLLPALDIGLRVGWVNGLLQRPGARFPKREGKHSWTLDFGNHYFTVIQLPDRNDEIGELLIERGWATSGGRNDRDEQETVNYLHHYMKKVFGPEWKEATMMSELRSKSVGITGDYLPFVGRIPREYANREVLRSDQAAVEAAVSEDDGLATPGEWISAGYNGQETAFALLSGHAVGIQIAGMEDDELEMVPGRPGGRLNDWFPKEELSLDGDRMVRANLGPLN